MPDGGPMPQQDPSQGAQPGQPQDGQGQESQQGQGGVAEVITKMDQMLYTLNEAVSKNPQLGDDVKAAFQSALDSFRKAEQALVKAAGGGEPDEDDQGGGATTPQQAGVSGAVPLTHQAMRGK